MCWRGCWPHCCGVLFLEAWTAAKQRALCVGNPKHISAGHHSQQQTPLSAHPCTRVAGGVSWPTREKWKKARDEGVCWPLGFFLRRATQIVKMQTRCRPECCECWDRKQLIWTLESRAGEKGCCGQTLVEGAPSLRRNNDKIPQIAWSDGWTDG